jgi:CRISPR-associated endonuclease/helicase Cas3
MLSITLSAQDEYQWLGENPAPRTFSSMDETHPCHPLYHQWRTYRAEAPMIVNTYNTGTGKTKAALLRLLRRVQQRQGQLRATYGNVLLIAPTNELLEQHAADAEQFCRENDLPYHVVRITAEMLDHYTQQYKDEQQFPDEHIRKGQVFYDILRDPSIIDPQHNTSKSLAIYVVNPDIFYYISYLLYNQFDRLKLFAALKPINYFIIDEFHYYTPKQLAAFLFFIQFSRENGFIDSQTTQRQFCLLTATPRPQVEAYLRHLDLPTDWITPIEPQQVPEADRPSIVPTRALTPVDLYVYSTEELQEKESSGGLLELVKRKRKELRHYMIEREWDGAIIANSLGMLNTLHHALTAVIPEERIGRITGPQKRESRQIEKKRQLILATPTVDIGYNFARSEEKRRQNIDFLFIDAYSGDELVQRIGRAGRVLSKLEKEHTSIVFAVVDPETYKQLRQYDNQELTRKQLADLAKEMPQKNDLYAYIRTGAISEAFRPLHTLRQGMDDKERELLNDFIVRLQRYFASTDEQRKARPVSVQALIAHARTFQEQDRAYQGLQRIPPQTFEQYELLLRNVLTEEQLDSAVKRCLKCFSERLEAVQKNGERVGDTTDDFMKWALHDLALYHKERARFSFRDSFQPPQALIYDPGRLHSSEYVNCYNAMHILKYYEFSPYETIEELLQEARPEQQRESWRDAVVFCHLNKFRDTPLKLGFHLNALQYTKAEWEEQWAYQVTALYGLKITVENDQRSLADTLHNMLVECFIPAFVYEERTSATSAQIRRLQNKARFYPYQLKVAFYDNPEVVYNVIVGSMAFHICAELPFWAMMRDRYKGQREANEPIIC